jgi:hypothetical protein
MPSQCTLFCSYTIPLVLFFQAGVFLQIQKAQSWMNFSLCMELKTWLESSRNNPILSLIILFHFRQNNLMPDGGTTIAECLSSLTTITSLDFRFSSYISCQMILCVTLFNRPWLCTDCSTDLSLPNTKWFPALASDKASFCSHVGVCYDRDRGKRMKAQQWFCK